MKRDTLESVGAWLGLVVALFLLFNINARLDGFASDLADVRERLGRIEGYLEGRFGKQAGDD